MAAVVRELDHTTLNHLSTREECVKNLRWRSHSTAPAHGEVLCRPTTLHRPTAVAKIVFFHEFRDGMVLTSKPRVVRRGTSP